MQNTTHTSKTIDLANQLFKQNIDISSVVTYPKYKLVDGGERVMIELAKDKFKGFGVHHISEEGILCDDLETYIKWEMFS